MASSQLEGFFLHTAQGSQRRGHGQRRFKEKPCHSVVCGSVPALVREKWFAQVQECRWSSVYRFVALVFLRIKLSICWEKMSSVVVVFFGLVGAAFVVAVGFSCVCWGFEKRNLVTPHPWHLDGTTGCQSGSDNDRTRTEAQTMWALVAVGKNDPSFPRPLSTRWWLYASSRTTAHNTHANVSTETGVSNLRHHMHQLGQELLLVTPLRHRLHLVSRCTSISGDRVPLTDVGFCATRDDAVTPLGYGNTQSWENTWCSHCAKNLMIVNAYTTLMSAINHRRSPGGPRYVFQTQECGACSPSGQKVLTFLSKWSPSNGNFSMTLSIGAVAVGMRQPNMVVAVPFDRTID